MRLLALGLASAWLGVLSVAVCVLLRQVAILTRKLGPGLQPPAAPERFSLMINGDLPTEVLQVAPELDAGTVYLVYLSATCTSCRQVATELPHLVAGSYRVLPVVTGSERLVQGFRDLWGDTVRPVVGEAAETIVETLSLTSTPFVLQVHMGRIAGWSTVHDISGDITKLDEALQGALLDADSAINAGAAAGT